jgi:NADPH-dependent 2,4-dienoyl-CoA reductase/sulfur reductase-like enzyme
MKVIAIGGDAASMSAMSKLRRMDENVEIHVFEMGEIVSYGACGMPYYVSDEIKESDTLIVRTKAAFEKRGIHVHLNHEVINVLEDRKEVVVKNLETLEESTHQYDKLLVGSGATPFKVPVKNNDLDNIYSITTIPDSVAIKEKMQSGKVKDVVIVGAGFIGVEMVEAFSNYDVNITVIEQKNQILDVFDADMIKYVEDYLISQNIQLKRAESVTAFEGVTTVKKVITDKDSYAADLVLVAIGLKPNTQFLNKKAFKLAKNGAVIVNRKMETSIKDVYAAGDCSLIYNRLLKKPVYLPLGNNANKQGRIVAENLTGKEVEIDGVLGTTIIKIMDMEAARTGLSEKQAKAEGIPYKSAVIKGRNHAHYYPASEAIRVKVLYDPNTFRLLGAQLIGRSDTAIRINPFVVAISVGMTTQEFHMMDFGYAPPFAGTWDVISIAAGKAS